MRILLLLIVALLIAAVPFGCNTSSDHGVNDSGFDRDGGTDGGPDGGTDGGPDGGIDGGPDGGIDGGIDGGVCDNTVEMVLQEERYHVDFGTPLTYNHNPPVQGRHYPLWARWQIHAEVVPRGWWVHNLEHGAVVFLYHPDAGADFVPALTRIYNDIPDDPDCQPPGPVHKRVVLTPDPELDAPWAVAVAGPEPEYLDGGFWGYGFSIKANCIADAGFLVQFAVEHRNHSAEQICDEGFYP